MVLLITSQRILACDFFFKSEPTTVSMFLPFSCYYNKGKMDIVGFLLGLQTSLTFLDTVCPIRGGYNLGTGAWW